MSESWGERVGVTLWYEDPEYEDDEGIFRALAMSGTPEDKDFKAVTMMWVA